MRAQEARCCLHRQGCEADRPPSMNKAISSRGITKWSYVPYCYPNHLWGMPPAEEEEHTHSPLLLPSWPRDSRRELVLRPGWEWEGESSVITWKPLCVVLLEITATTNAVLSYISEAPKLHFWSSETPKIWEFEVTSACPAAPSCAPRGGTQPAFTLPACDTSGSPHSSSLQKQLVLDTVLKCEYSTPQLGNKILAMKM